MRVWPSLLLNPGARSHVGISFGAGTMQIEGEKGLNTNKLTAWKRGLFMLLFAAAFGVGQSLLILLAVVQFLWLLFAGEPNLFLLRFGRSLSAGLQTQHAS